MSKTVNPSRSLLSRTDDILLGAVGASIPESEWLDHACRYLSTWSGPDKLMMTVQFTARLTNFYLNSRAERLYRVGKRAQPISPTVQGLTKLAALLSMTRRLSGLWGVLGIMKGLSGLERNKPASRLQLNLQRIQGVSMLVFYPLEFISFFTAPWAPILSPYFTPAQSATASLWSIRAWGVFVLAQITLAYREYSAIRSREKKENINGTLEHDVVEEKDVAKRDADKEKSARRKVILLHTLTANISRLPVIAHWGVVGGVYPYEILTPILSLISAVAALHGGWEGTRLPSPQR